MVLRLDIPARDFRDGSLDSSHRERLLRSTERVLFAWRPNTETPEGVFTGPAMLFGREHFQARRAPEHTMKHANLNHHRVRCRRIRAAGAIRILRAVGHEPAQKRTCGSLAEIQSFGMFEACMRAKLTTAPRPHTNFHRDVLAISERLNHKHLADCH
jgi:hypothetical protein